MFEVFFCPCHDFVTPDPCAGNWTHSFSFSPRCICWCWHISTWGERESEVWSYHFITHSDSGSQSPVESLQCWRVAQYCARRTSLGCQSCPALRSVSSLFPCTHRCASVNTPNFERIKFDYYKWCCIMILVVDILPNSGVGGEAGLKKGDVLLAIQGRKVDDMSAYRSYRIHRFV